MGLISNLLAKAKARKEKVREFEENERIMENAAQKHLSHSERELIKLLKQEKEKAMNETLYWENRRRMAEEKKKARDMMKFNSEMFKNESILKEKKDFFRGGNW